MQVQDHVWALHFFEHRIERRVVHYSRERFTDGGGSVVRGHHAGRIALHAGNSSFLSLDDGFRGDALVEKERHEEIHPGFKGLQSFLIFKSMLNGRNRRNEIVLMESSVKRNWVTDRGSPLP